MVWLVGVMVAGVIVHEHKPHFELLIGPNLKDKCNISKYFYVNQI